MDFGPRGRYEPGARLLTRDDITAQINAELKFMGRRGLSVVDVLAFEWVIGVLIGGRESLLTESELNHLKEFIAEAQVAWVKFFIVNVEGLLSVSPEAHEALEAAFRIGGSEAVAAMFNK